MRPLLKRATENHVFLGPGMNTAAMRAGKLLRFHLGGRPELFFYGAASISQFGRRRATHEQALEPGAHLWFRTSWRIEKESRCHIKKLKSINNPRLGGIVGRHLHLYSISDG